MKTFIAILVLVHIISIKNEVNAQWPSLNIFNAFRPFQSINLLDFNLVGNLPTTLPIEICQIPFNVLSTSLSAVSTTFKETLRLSADSVKKVFTTQDIRFEELLSNTGASQDCIKSVSELYGRNQIESTYSTCVDSISSTETAKLDAIAQQLNVFLNSNDCSTAVSYF